MIDQVDDALEKWLNSILDGVTVSFDPPTETSGSRAKPRLHLFLRSLQEKDRARGGWMDDVRDAQDLVTARQRSLRWFTSDYLVVASGDARQQHKTLAAMLQVMVDNDFVPQEFTPAVLTERDLRIEIEPGITEGSTELFSSLGIPARSVATLLVTAPVLPTPDTEIGPPVTELDLEFPQHPQPADGAGTRNAETGVPESVPDHIVKRWTAVRMHEFATPVEERS